MNALVFWVLCLQGLKVWDFRDKGLGLSGRRFDQGSWYLKGLGFQGRGWGLGMVLKV